MWNSKSSALKFLAMLILMMIMESHHAQGAKANPTFTMEQAKALYKTLKPRIENTPRVSANDGENVTLTCKVTGYPEPKVSWTWNKRPLGSIKYHVRGPNLTLIGVMFEDMGDFYCTAENIFGKVTSSVKLVVNGPPRLVKFPPAHLTGYTGKTTFIPCKTVGNPAPSVLWTRPPDKPLPQGRHRITADGLEIYRTLPTDVGIYVCIGIDARMTPRSGATLLALKDVVTPRFTISPPSLKKVISIGNTVRVRCEATGDPKPAVTWLFNGATVQRNSGELVIENFQFQDEGMYKCVAKNKYGNSVEKHTRIALVTCGPPRTPLNGFRIGDKFRVGDSVSFGCNAGYVPQLLLGSRVSVCKASGVWYPNDRRFVCSVRKFGIRLVGGSNSKEGRVEVFHNGEWGTVCDDNWDLNEAKVVCRYLGFSGAREAPCCARFGQGLDKILLTNVRCDGNENNIRLCVHSGWGYHACTHAEDAGVKCY